MSYEIAIPILRKHNSPDMGLIELSDIESYAKKLFKYATVICHYSQGSLAGIIAYYNNDPEKDLAFLSVLLVDLDHQGQGFGRKMLQNSIDDLVSKGFRRYRLEVLKMNHKALDLYKSYSFAIIEEKENVYVMERSL